MKTLIELYDERPIENVVSTELFRPERTVFLCSPDVKSIKKAEEKLKCYLLHRGVNNQLIFLKTSLLDAESVARSLRDVIAAYPDCALDISGGSDAALFSAGLVCAENSIPVFTYSRKKNTFFDIQNAPFAHDLPCTLQFNVEDCFLMAGGAVRTGRVDNGILSEYASLIDPMFQLFLRNRKDWNQIISYMQAVSQPEKKAEISLHVQGAYTVKSGNGRKVSAPEKALGEMERIGLISSLSVSREKGVSFDFADLQVRTWLRDVGSILELYTYQSCLETGLFHDVRTSVIVDWDSDSAGGGVSNEIDVMASRGITPLFISCKVCDVKTEALNELAVLRDRFGSQIARAAIVTAQQGGNAMRQRAQELGIRVIDLQDLKRGGIGSKLKALMQGNA